MSNIFHAAKHDQEMNTLRIRIAELEADASDLILNREAALQDLEDSRRYGEEQFRTRKQAEAALAERDRALDDLCFFLKPGDTVTVRTPGKRGSVTFAMDRLANLRVRAEEGGE